MAVLNIPSKNQQLSEITTIDIEDKFLETKKIQDKLEMRIESVEKEESKTIEKTEKLVEQVISMNTYLTKLSDSNEASHGRFETNLSGSNKELNNINKSINVLYNTIYGLGALSFIELLLLIIFGIKLVGGS